MLVGLSLATAGCRTFNYTDEDMERERKLISERVAGGRGYWACVEDGHADGGYVGISGFHLNLDNDHLNLGKFHCPNSGGGVCPRK